MLPYGAVVQLGEARTAGGTAKLASACRRSARMPAVTEIAAIEIMDYLPHFCSDKSRGALFVRNASIGLRLAPGGRAPTPKMIRSC